MNDTKKFTNLASAKIFEFGYNRNIDSKKFEYINVNNKITNFNINFVNKPKIEYQIESKSFEYSDSKFSVQKINDMILDHSKFSIIDDKKNKTFNCSVKKFKKIENYPSKSLTYNKIIEDTPKINLESSRTIKLKSQKREDSIFTTINKKNNILSNEDNNIKSSLKAINENHSDPTNISLNLDLLKNININHETKDENEFQKFQKMAADNGHAQAQVELGKKFAQTFSNIITNTQMFSYSGAEEDKLRNFSQSFKYYSMAAEKGNADAQFGIAKLLERYSVHPVYDVENIFADHVNLNVLGAEDVEILDNFFRALSINGTVADARNSKEEKERLRIAIHDVNRGDGLGPSTGPLILKWYREAARNGHKEAQKYLEDRKRLGLLTE